MFVRAYGDRPLCTIDHTVVAEWLKGGRNLSSVQPLRTMFNDARRTTAAGRSPARSQPVRAPGA
jgi:hypothetical protein